MKLIGSPTSPYVRKVCIVLAEKKLDYQLVVEDVWSANTTIHASNPLGKVPCLVLEGGEAVFDSRVIVEYLDTLSPVGKLIPANGRERAEVKTWEALADGLLDAALLARMEAVWPHRPPNSAAKPGLTVNCTKLQKPCAPCRMAWPTSLIARVHTSACQTLRWVAHWAIWISAFQPSNGVTAIPIWTSCTPS